MSEILDTHQTHVIEFVRKGGLMTESPVDNSRPDQPVAVWAVSAAAGWVIERARVPGSLDSFGEVLVVSGPDRGETVSW